MMDDQIWELDKIYCEDETKHFVSGTISWWEKVAGYKSEDSGKQSAKSGNILTSILFLLRHFSSRLCTTFCVNVFTVCQTRTNKSIIFIIGLFVSLSVRLWTTHWNNTKTFHPLFNRNNNVSTAMLVDLFYVKVFTVYLLEDSPGLGGVAWHQWQQFIICQAQQAKKIIWSKHLFISPHAPWLAE